VRVLHSTREEYSTVPYHTNHTLLCPTLQCTAHCVPKPLPQGHSAIAHIPYSGGPHSAMHGLPQSTCGASITPIKLTNLEYPLSTMRRCMHVQCRCKRQRTRASAQLRRTGGDGGAQQRFARGAGADRVGVEVRIRVVGARVAAPRVVSVDLHEIRPRGLARGGGRGAARRLGLDPHGARRALVAATGTGDVRACARCTAHAATPRGCE
jgi:hypothetical protein